MSITKKLCLYCRTSFFPNARLGDRQVTCGSDDCKKQQRRAGKRSWARKNKTVVRDNLKDWLSTRPGYWKDYRRDHPDYARRNRTQTRIRKSLLRTGLQNRTDISQPFESTVQFLSFARFAKCPRSLFPLPFAYTPAHAAPRAPRGGGP